MIDNPIVKHGFYIPHNYKYRVFVCARCFNQTQNTTIRRKKMLLAIFVLFLAGFLYVHIYKHNKLFHVAVTVVMALRITKAVIMAIKEVIVPQIEGSGV